MKLFGYSKNSKFLGKKIAFQRPQRPREKFSKSEMTSSRVLCFIWKPRTWRASVYNTSRTGWSPARYIPSCIDPDPLNTVPQWMGNYGRCIWSEPMSKEYLNEYFPQSLTSWMMTNETSEQTPFFFPERTDLCDISGRIEICFLVSSQLKLESDKHVQEQKHRVFVSCRSKVTKTYPHNTTGQDRLSCCCGSGTGDTSCNSQGES